MPMKTYKIIHSENKDSVIEYYVDDEIESSQYYKEGITPIMDGYLNSDSVEVPLWRIKGILTVSGMIESVEQAISKLPEPDKTFATLSWNQGSVVSRSSKTLKFIQDSLRLSDQDVDNIFLQAKSISI